MAGRLQVVQSEDGWSTPPVEGQELGSSFSWSDRLFQGWRDGKVFDYSDWVARDMEEMLRKSHKARQLEGVLTFPLMSAERTIAPADGDKGESDWFNRWIDLDEFSGGMSTPFDTIVGQMSSALIYKKAFWEKVWGPTPDGKIAYTKLAWRPQTTCRAMRDPQTAVLLGFEQEAYGIGPLVTKGSWPVQIQLKNAFVYVHGQQRDPVNGVSDFEIAYWAYKTQQKLLFLWFNYLERQSHPLVLAKSNDIGTAVDLANQIAKAKGGGVIPVSIPGGPGNATAEILDPSGKGATEFMAAITWLEQAAANSVQAGFTNLTDQAKTGGAYALSKDASDFFLQQLEHKSKEMAREIRRQVIAPVIRYNFGPDAAVPLFTFEPLNTEDKSTSVEMLSNLLRSRDPALVPDEFIGELAAQVADYIGLDGKKTRDAFDKAAKEAKARAAAMAAQGLAAGGATPAGQAVAGMAGATNAAAKAIQNAHQKGTQSIPGINAPQMPSSY